MKQSAAPYVLLIVLLAMLFVVVLAVHSKNESDRISRLRSDTKIELQEYCIDHNLIPTDCGVWADGETRSLSALGVEWASSCTNNDPAEQQLLFCVSYAKDLK